MLRDQGLDYRLANASDVPSVVLARNGRVWGLYAPGQAAEEGILEGREPWATRAGFYATWLLFPLSIAGMVLLRRRGITIIPFVASLAVVVFASTAFTGLVSRFRVPWDVSTCVLAAITIVYLVDRWRTRPSEPEPTTTAAVPVE